MQKIIHIREIDTVRFFLAYLEIIACNNPIKLLAKGEKKLLAIIMYYNNKYKTLDKKDRHELIFSTSKRKEIMSLCKITEGVFNNYISQFRKHNIMLDNTINEEYEVFPDDNNEIIFKIPIKK